MFRLNPAEIKRQLKRLGIKNVDVDVFTAEEVTIQLEDGRTLVAATPQVMVVKLPTGQAMIQVVTQSLEERTGEAEESAASFSEDDINLIVEQTGVTPEEARKALEEAGGDLAAAIMLIEERKRAS